MRNVIAKKPGFIKTNSFYLSKTTNVEYIYT